MNYITRSPTRCVSCWSLQGRPHGPTCQFANFTVHAQNRS